MPCEVPARLRAIANIMMARAREKMEGVASMSQEQARSAAHVAAVTVSAEAKHAATIAAQKAGIAAEQVSGTAKERAGQAAGIALEKAGVAKETAVHVAEQVAGTERVAVAKEKAGQAAGLALEKATVVKEKAGNVADEVMGQAADGGRRLAFEGMEKAIKRITPKIQAYLYQQVLDPDMPRTVKRGVSGLVEAFATELEPLLLEQAANAVFRKQVEDWQDEPVPSCCDSPLGCFWRLRAVVLYQVMPRHLADAYLAIQGVSNLHSH